MMTAFKQRELMLVVLLFSAVCASRPRVALQPQWHNPRERTLDRPLLALRGGWVNKPGTDCDASSCQSGRKCGEDGAMEGDGNCTTADESTSCPHGSQTGNKDLHCMECEVMAFLQVSEVDFT
jgi:hypothetical protein